MTTAMITLLWVGTSILMYCIGAVVVGTIHDLVNVDKETKLSGLNYDEFRLWRGWFFVFLWPVGMLILLGAGLLYLSTGLAPKILAWRERSKLDEYEKAKEVLEEMEEILNRNKP